MSSDNSPMIEKKTKVSWFKKITKEFSSAFKATGNNHVYKNRKTIIKSIVLCFIPFLYAFIALWAFFDPLGNINRLPIALVNQDVSAQGDDRVINLNSLSLADTSPNKYGAYEFDINNIKMGDKQKNFKVYYFDDLQTYQKHQNDVTFLSEILISDSFTHQWNNYFSKVFDIIINPPAGENIWEAISKIADKPQITLQGSYKVNPILGEINDFVLNILKDNIFGKFFPVIISDKVFDFWNQDAIAAGSVESPNYENLKPQLLEIYNYLAILVPGLGAHQSGFEQNISEVNSTEKWKIARSEENSYWKNHSLTGPLEFVKFNVNIIGQEKSPYGFGLGPYFMCIGMWVGGLLLTFNFTRNKANTKNKFWSNYLAKASWMVIFGLIQATILTTALLLLFNNADLFHRFWQLFLFMWFMAICFDLIIQGIAHMFRDHDLGRFLIVILLVLQLSGSGGTFPVELEPTFFQIITHILPFTYAIRGLREILIAPNPVIILINIAIILAIVAIIMIISLTLNWLYDYLDARRLKSSKSHKKSKKYFWRVQKDIVIEEENPN